MPGCQVALLRNGLEELLTCHWLERSPSVSASTRLYSLYIIEIIQLTTISFYFKHIRRVLNATNRHCNGRQTTEVLKIQMQPDSERSQNCLSTIVTSGATSSRCHLWRLAGHSVSPLDQQHCPFLPSKAVALAELPQVDQLDPTMVQTMKRQQIPSPKRVKNWQHLAPRR